MADGEANEKARAAEIQPAAEIVIAVLPGEIGCSVNKKGYPRTTLAIGNVDVAPAVRAEEGKVKTGGEKGKEQRAAIDLEKGMGVQEMEGEKLCRICHLSSEMVGPMEEGWELIEIGCGCKGDLGIAHRRCAEAWFRVKGNRLCEICGLTAKSIVGMEYCGPVEVCRENRSQSGAVNQSLQSRGASWTGQRFCSFLVAFLVIAFVLQWYFRESGTRRHCCASSSPKGVHRAAEESRPAFVEPRGVTLCVRRAQRRSHALLSASPAGAQKRFVEP